MKNHFLSFLILVCSPALLTSQHFQYKVLSTALKANYKLDFCGETVPLKNPDVRRRFEKQLLLTLQNAAQVILWIKRSHRYLTIIEKMLKQNRMPNDLKYIAIIESALRPHATSTKNAVGFWQFTKSSGRMYGLEVNSEIDERRNIFKSTAAAIRYFKALYADYESWSLCAAAYNMGENGLKTEILMQNVRDYYQLYLPLETQQYLLRLVCAKLVLSIPKRFGFDINEIKKYPRLKFDRVTIKRNKKTPIVVIAEAAGTYYKRIKDLNPEIRGYYLAKGRRQVLIPAGTRRRFERSFKELVKTAKEPEQSQIHIVQKGDNLTTIANKFNVSVGALLIWNNLKASDTLHPGDKIIIYPGRPGNSM